MRSEKDHAEHLGEEVARIFDQEARHALRQERRFFENVFFTETAFFIVVVERIGSVFWKTSLTQMISRVPTSTGIE